MRLTPLGPIVALVVGSLAWAACSGEDTTSSPADAGGDRAEPAAPGVADSGSAPEPVLDGGADAASGIDAPEVSFQYGSCAPFVACGGAPAGTWRYAAGGCVDELSIAMCPTLEVKSSTLKMRGILTIGATTLERLSEAKVTAAIAIPPECTAQANGSCALVQLGLILAPPGGPGFDTASCVNGAAQGSCECEVEETIFDQSSTTYTLSGTSIVTADQKTYEFCVGGDAGPDTLAYRDRVANLVDATFALKR